MPRSEHIPLDLLETFVEIVEHEGDAGAAGRTLDITQPTVSKRLAALRRLTSEPDGEPWLLLKGKRWLLTDEGQRVLGVVSDVVTRHRQMEDFVRGERAGRKSVSVACGQQASQGFMRTAVKQFLKAHPDSRVRISTPRSKSRIEGVAGGQFDLAIVSESAAEIHHVAGMELYVETLFEDEMVLVGNPLGRSQWKKQWAELSELTAIRPKDLVGLPFITPEADASRRQQLDDWIKNGAGQQLDIVIETGGWQSILGYVIDGIGAAIVPRSSLDSAVSNTRKLTPFTLPKRSFQCESAQLVTRKARGQNRPDVPTLAERFATIVREASR